MTEEISKLPSVSATEAHRKFYALVRSASQGAGIEITRRGRPIAQLLPFQPETDGDESEREESR